MHSQNGSQITQQGANSAIIPDNATPYQQKATLYAYTQLQSVYGQKYRAAFKTEEELRNSRRQWATNLGNLEREQIDKGIELLKLELAADNPKYEWPDIGRFIGLCNRKEIPLVDPTLQRLNDQEAADGRTWEEKQIDAQKQLGKLRTRLRRAKRGIHIAPGNDLAAG